MAPSHGSTGHADLLSAVAGEAKTKKTEGHWIGRFTHDEYKDLCKVFGRDWIPPKDIKALLMAIPAGKVGLYDPMRFDLVPKTAPPA